MKKQLSKLFMTAVAVLVMLGIFPTDYTAENYSTPFAVTVQAAAKKVHLKKTKITLTTGKTYTLKLLDKKGKTISAAKVKWKSANTKIATVSKKGKITAKKKGKVIITATYKGKKYTCTVTVKKATSTNSKGDPDKDDAKNGTVYRTPTGKKYHLDPQCGGKNSSATTKTKAVKAGLTPCSKCAK